MIEPALAFRTAVRTALIGAAAVTALVPANQIRAGWTRPDDTPSIALTGEQTVFLGHAPGSQFVARVYLDLHIWAPDGGADLAQAIGAAVALVLFDAPTTTEIAIDDYVKPSITWMRDPAPERSLTHGVMQLEAVVRWPV
ncbi:DUF3168 domain-containing protein [Mameliella sp. AT18]|uniref:tail completion protein gp17 n=1 Tax=Mameliella sp. AT18 TaxID=3028385 RepID=UPI00237A6601|nr:DUF3168 domain-containing protein [Mameliella sp. AT18]MDD9730450.1 DUF3168 domain-containing protein [Mameliella sp. AT18]